MTFTKVGCKLSDCIYYKKSETRPGVVYCKHPDVVLYRTDKRCPLYRVDWTKKADQAKPATGFKK